MQICHVKMHSKMSASGDVMHAGSVLCMNRVWLSESTIICAGNRMSPRKWSTIIDSIRWIIVGLQQMAWTIRRRTNKKNVPSFYFSRNFSLSLSLSLSVPLSFVFSSPVHFIPFTHKLHRICQYVCATVSCSCHRTSIFFLFLLLF